MLQIVCPGGSSISVAKGTSVFPGAGVYFFFVDPLVSALPPLSLTLSLSLFPLLPLPL